MEKQIVEINGIKMEIDMRHATRIDTMVVGSKVKVLIKSTYSSPSVYPGVVVGFEAFKELPTIIVCYLEHSYSEAKLQFAYINASTNEKYDLVLSVDEELPIAKDDVLAQMDKEISKKQEEIDQIMRKRDYFLKHFNKYFEAA
jgi:hypothetical protein